jgi:hypothetical protein
MDVRLGAVAFVNVPAFRAEIRGTTATSRTTCFIIDVTIRLGRDMLCVHGVRAREDRGEGSRHGGIVSLGFLDWASLILGAGLIGSGVRAIRRRRASVPELWEGAVAVRLGWLWVGLGVLFVLAVIFDIRLLKTVFRLFLEAAN